MRKGFTLVELSIVLVIIGLLTGGLLVAQSMIETAKIGNVIKQIQQADIAVSNFKTLYSALPGDNSAFDLQDTWAIFQTVTKGNNDGYISYNPIGGAPFAGAHCSNSSLGCAYFVGEIANFWAHLSQAGQFQGKFVPDIPAGGFNSDPQNLNVPRIKAFGNMDLVPFPCNHPSTPNCYQIADYTALKDNTGHFGSAIPLVPPQAMVALDNKLDDGKPLTGILQNVFGDLGFGPYNTLHDKNLQRLTDENSAYICSDLDNSKVDSPETAVYTLDKKACYFSFGILTQVPNN